MIYQNVTIISLKIRKKTKKSSKTIYNLQLVWYNIEEPYVNLLHKIKEMGSENGKTIKTIL